MGYLPDFRILDMYFLIYFYFVKGGVEHYSHCFGWCFLVFHCLNKPGSAVIYYPTGLVYKTAVYLLLTQLPTCPVQPGHLPFHYTLLLPPKYNMSTVCGSGGFYTHTGVWLSRTSKDFTKKCVPKQAPPPWNLCSIYFKGGKMRHQESNRPQCLNKEDLLQR